MSRTQARIDRARDKHLESVHHIQRQFIRGSDAHQILRSTLFLLAEAGNCDRGLIVGVGGNGRVVAGEFLETLAVIDLNQPSAFVDTPLPTFAWCESFQPLLEGKSVSTVTSTELPPGFQLSMFADTDFSQLICASLEGEAGQIDAIVVLASDSGADLMPDDLDVIIDCCESVLIAYRRQQANDVTNVKGKSISAAEVNSSRPLSRRISDFNEDEMFSLMLRELPAVLWTMDSELRFTTSVGAGLSKLDLNPGQVVGMLLEDFVVGSPSADVILRSHRQALSGKITEFETEFAGRTYQNRVQPMFDANGDVEGCMGLAFDVTESRKLELERRRSERRWQAVVQNVPDFILVIDAEARIKYINFMAAGWESDEVIEANIFDFNEPEFHGAIRGAMDLAFNSGETSVYETVGRGKPDEWRQYMCRMAPMHIEDEQPLAVIVATDVTDYLKAKEDERRHYSLLKTVTNGISDLIFIKDLSGRLIFANEACNKLYDTSVLGLTDFDFMPEDIARKVQDADRRVIESRDSVTYEEVLPTNSGSRTFLTTKTPWFGDSGEIIGVLGIAHDISTRKDAEQTIERQRAALYQAQRFSTLGRTMGEITHEIKQPLAAISNYAATCRLGLKNKPLDLDQIGNFLNLIIRESNRADEVIKKIRALTARGKVKHVACNLQELIESTIELIDTEVADRKVAVRFERQDTDLQVHADRTLIRQVIVNLIINACDAMRHQEEGDRQVEVNCQIDQDMLVTCVVDSGPGLNSSALSRVFEPFFSTKEDGMGLGLAICSEIVKAHHGKIGVFNNTPAKGATFWFSLPQMRGQGR